MADRYFERQQESAGRLAVKSIPIFPETCLLREVRAQLRKPGFESIEAVLALDAKGRYAGAASLGDVLRAPDSATLASVERKDWPRVSPDTDQEHAAGVAYHRGVTAIPVVEADGRPFGLVPALALLETLAQEHQEDLHRLAGILKQRAGARQALDDPPWRRAGARLPWLLVGLALSTAATAVMAGFERVLHANILVAFFIPALVYLADAVGTQTEAIAVRGLSLRMRPLPPLLLSEIATGILIGLPLSLLAFLGIFAVYGELWLAFGVAAALFAASTLASAFGLVLPWLLARAGTDPAFGSGPVATIVQDVLTIVIYFAIMVLVLAP
jgi:magnesium transporter